MAGLVAGYGEASRNIYLPTGGWFDFHTGSKHTGNNSFLNNVTNWQNGVFRIPLFVKEGAIIPMMFVDEQTQNISGKRKDKVVITATEVLIAPSSTKTEFLMSDDDGKTIAYKSGAVEKTFITQELKGSTLEVFISKTNGMISKEQSVQNKVYILSTDQIKSVSLSGVQINKCSSSLVTNCFKKVGHNKYLIQVENVARKDDKLYTVKFK
jgi:alpha-glucosidase